MRLFTWEWSTEPENYAQFNRPESELKLRYREDDWFIMIRRAKPSGYTVTWMDMEWKIRGVRTCKEAVIAVREVIGERLAKEFAGAT